MTSGLCHRLFFSIFQQERSPTGVTTYWTLYIILLAHRHKRWDYIITFLEFLLFVQDKNLDIHVPNVSDAEKNAELIYGLHRYLLWIYIYMSRYLLKLYFLEFCFSKTFGDGR